MKTMEKMLGLIVVAACSGGSKQTPAPPGGGGGGGGGQQPALTAAEVTGYWTGDWGQLVFREKDGKILGSYSHDEGTIVGTIQGDTLVGWWCEVPSRKPPQDAGDVEMKFVTKDGKRMIDGRWRYGSEEELKENWDIDWNGGEPDAALVTRFDDPAAFCTKP